MINECGFFLGKRLPDEYSIEVDGRMLDSARTTDIEGVKALLPDVLANGYADAKIVRVVTFTQEIHEQPTNGE